MNTVGKALCVVAVFVLFISCFFVTVYEPQEPVYEETTIYSVMLDGEWNIESMTLTTDRDVLMSSDLVVVEFTSEDFDDYLDTRQLVMNLVLKHIPVLSMIGNSIFDEEWPDGVVSWGVSNSEYQGIYINGSNVFNGHGTNVRDDALPGFISFLERMGYTPSSQQGTELL